MCQALSPITMPDTLIKCLQKENMNKTNDYIKVGIYSLTKKQ